MNGLPVEDDEPAWRKLRLTLERPYKDDHGNPIHQLLDVTPEGQQIYEPAPDPNKQLAESIRRVFAERGHDFFEKRDAVSGRIDIESSNDPDDEHEETSAETVNPSTQPMTPEQLFKMRSDIIPRLDIALGEMTEARNLLLLLLSSVSAKESDEAVPPVPNLPPKALTATTVTKPPPIQSVQTFDVQLVIGSKDESLRKAANLFKSTATNMEESRLHGEQYWANALKIRKDNWGLLPAPLPFGSFLGKGADKTSSDFLVSFGMEESPATFRRKAIGHMATYGENTSSALVYPHRQNTRLRVTLQLTDNNGVKQSFCNRVVLEDESDLYGSLKAAQTEVVEEEIFSVLIREASSLPTASARVSERLIVVEAAHGTELTFELVDNSLLAPGDEQDGPEYGGFYGVLCSLIIAALRLLLVRGHGYEKAKRLGGSETSRVNSSKTLVAVQQPHILQKITDLTQYHVFCRRLKEELDKTTETLSEVGIKTLLRFNPAGESSHQITKLLTENSDRRLGGDASLYMDERYISLTLPMLRWGLDCHRYSLHFTFESPSTLAAHLTNTTLSISSIPQLCQLLLDETERFLLGRICEVGRELCEPVNGAWFLDQLTSRSVGRWEGNVLYVGCFSFPGYNQ
ncbi:hypothetical protein BDM02DRAFT_3089535 [Thelephora ganbajun]|uniref:Uncharacterized protein n=1 Tax=Thelephora ganbajun TaxID=370292 RepID=A0ACB6ZRJ4_THEGA|nr:hypothetical protein BDM02DRAFT_3089535 [Thelephora ganbajun]